MTCAIRCCMRGNVVRWGLCVGHAFLYVLGPRLTLAAFVSEHEVRHALHKLATSTAGGSVEEEAAT